MTRLEKLKAKRATLQDYIKKTGSTQFAERLSNLNKAIFCLEWLENNQKIIDELI